ncbi:MAG TPA: hypothetical protein VLT47_14250 [Anaeromyxobacteraceae bacterium]|nr:hypothetical protein [Anaeromyxobacteraceae bacterium]
MIRDLAELPPRERWVHRAAMGGIGAGRASAAVLRQIVAEDDRTARGVDRLPVLRASDVARAELARREALDT